MHESEFREKISLKQASALVLSEECCLGLIRSAEMDAHLLLAKG